MWFGKLLPLPSIVTFNRSKAPNHTVPYNKNAKAAGVIEIDGNGVKHDKKCMCIVSFHLICDFPRHCG